MEISRPNTLILKRFKELLDKVSLTKDEKIEFCGLFNKLPPGEIAIDYNDNVSMPTSDSHEQDNKAEVDNFLGLD